MFQWTYSEQIETDATAAQIWALWSDANNWPQWDSELDWVKLDGAFENGTQGMMKPSSGPKVTFTLEDVVENQEFHDTAKLPLATIRFSHEYFPAGSDGKSASIRHSVEIKGITTPLFKRVIGGQIQKHLKQAMTTLSAMAAALNPA